MDALPAQEVVARVLLPKKGVIHNVFIIFVSLKITDFTFNREIKPTKWSVTKGDLGVIHPKFYHLSIF